MVYIYEGRMYTLKVSEKLKACIREWFFDNMDITQRTQL